jgi:hypothetical protein
LKKRNIGGLEVRKGRQAGRQAGRQQTHGAYISEKRELVEEERNV